MLKVLEKLFGENNEAKLKAMHPILDRINSLEDELTKLTDDELKAKTPYFKQLIYNKLKDVQDKLIIPEDAPKIPGVIRTTKDKATSEILEKISVSYTHLTLPTILRV